MLRGIHSIKPILTTSWLQLITTFQEKSFLAVSKMTSKYKGTLKALWDFVLSASKAKIPVLKEIYW